MWWDHPELSGPKEAWLVTRISQTGASVSGLSFASGSPTLPGAEVVNLGVRLAPRLSLLPTSHLSSDPIGSSFKTQPESANFSLPPLAGGLSHPCCPCCPLAPPLTHSSQRESVSIQVLSCPTCALKQVQGGPGSHLTRAKPKLPRGLPSALPMSPAHSAPVIPPHCCASTRQMCAPGPLHRLCLLCPRVGFQGGPL